TAIGVDAAMLLPRGERVAVRLLLEVRGPACVGRTALSRVEAMADRFGVGRAFEEEARSAAALGGGRERVPIGAPDEGRVGDDAASARQCAVGLAEQLGVDLGTRSRSVEVGWSCAVRLVPPQDGPADVRGPGGLRQ